MTLATTIISIFGGVKTFLFYTWPFLLLVYVWINKVRWSKYPLEAVIIEKRGENLIKTNDRVGRFFDKFSEMVFYKMKKSGDTIPIYNYDWVLHNVAVPTNILERYINILQGNTGTIFLFRYGSKQYKPINVRENGQAKVKLVPIKNEKGETIYSYQYVHFDPRQLMGLIDFEVVDWDNINFMVQEQRASMVRRAKKNEWLKNMVVPLAIIAGSVLVSLFILKFSFDASHDIRGIGEAQQSNGIDSGQGEVMKDSKVGGVINNIISPGQ